MIELQADLWSNFTGYRQVIRCITTNGFTKKTGEAVMGRGCAREAAVRYPDFPMIVGKHLLAMGNIVGGVFRMRDGMLLLTFPVKHHWSEPADPALIEASARELLEFTALPDTMFILPRPGCGNGRLNWDRVRPLISFLPDNVVIVSKG